MWTWFKALDSVLRGDATHLSRLRGRQLEVPAGGLLVVAIILGMAYGFCMGWYALFNRESPEYLQVLATMVKVPALFVLTLLVTFPSLYVFNALVGSRLTAMGLVRLIVAAEAVTLAVLASFGPIVAFFSVTTTSYHFMVILNVIVFMVAGFLGLLFLLQTLHRLSLPIPVRQVRPAPEAEGTQPADLPDVLPVESAGALDRVSDAGLGKNVKFVFTCWILVFALVGAQMSWILRPFIGNPEQPFALFRPRESHFFESFWRTLVHLFS